MVDRYLTQNINAVSQSKLGKELNYQKNDLALSKQELQALINEDPRESQSPGDKTSQNLNHKKSAGDLALLQNTRSSVFGHI